VFRLLGQSSVLTLFTPTGAQGHEGVHIGRGDWAGPH